ncbi:MAG: adenine phosphoribosyltransferase [Pirellulales bacterium]|nr:adenine phosphoribosyltransferase [Pirellulales bacterium]
MPSPSPLARLDLRDFIGAVPDFPKRGVLFRDITPLLASPEAFAQAIDQLAEQVRGKQVGRIVAAEARGFLLAAPLALKLRVPLVPIRKPGKLPGRTVSHSYHLEYGTDTLEMLADAVPSGARILVVDDLLATGGTVDACCRMVEEAGGVVVGCAFLIELVGLGGADKLAPRDVIRLIQYEE